MVSIIIINFNTYQLTCSCIGSVIRHTKNILYEIILVDNASTECDPDLFIQQFPEINLVKSSINAGFAVGNNIGISHAKGNIILLLNSDTILTEDSVSRAANVMQENKKIDILGCRMIYPNGIVQYSARRFRSISWELLDLFKFIPWILPYKRSASLMLGKYFRHDEDIECDWVNGAFFMFHSKILDCFPQHKLDERFFMYGEDQLWCFQLKKTGKTVFFYSGTSIIHIHSGSTRPGKVLSLRKIMITNELTIARERLGAGANYQIFRLIFLFKEYARYALKWFFWKVTGRLIK